MPEIKKQLFDFDIYRVSWLTDEEIGRSGKKPEGAGAGCCSRCGRAHRASSKSPRAYNSVRAFIDKMIGTGEKESAKGKLKAAPECCESFLLLF